MAPSPHSGPEIPPSFRTLQKWMAMKMTVMNGKNNTCSTYHRSRVSDPISAPPSAAFSSSCRSRGELAGTASSLPFFSGFAFGEIPTDPVAMIAVGYPGNAEDLPAELQQKEYAPRARNGFGDFVFTGAWGKALPFESRVKRALAGD